MQYGTRRYSLRYKPPQPQGSPQPRAQETGADLDPWVCSRLLEAGIDVNSQNHQLGGTQKKFNIPVRISCEMDESLIYLLLIMVGGGIFGHFAEPKVSKIERSQSLCHTFQRRCGRFSEWASPKRQACGACGRCLCSTAYQCIL